MSPEPGLLCALQGPAVLVRQHRDQEAGVSPASPGDNKVVAETAVIRTLCHVVTIMYFFCIVVCLRFYIEKLMIMC